MNNELMFSSKTELWSTPQDLFDRLNKIFNFNTDVCAIDENAKCINFYSPKDNGLVQNWVGTCWMNPPYGRAIATWVKKAYESAKNNGSTIVCLLPARVDTIWWHDFCSKGEIYFLRGRLKFSGNKNSAPFPSAIVVFRPNVIDAFC